ncbi:hypothetical protein [Fibrisoma limi]|uniref:hypothetical protein n=1 Tax=Fibrisoma limi TaxID=663275 RepID=UPI000587D2E2|nr:hypothetical protein [Fibrisoma limi]
MRPLKVLFQLLKSSSTPDPIHRQRRTAKRNLLLCVIGMAISFVYLFQQNPAGWLFMAGFAFFLIKQVEPDDDFTDNQ